MNSIHFEDFSIGRLGITEEDGFITNVFFAENTDLPRKTLGITYKPALTPLIESTVSQLHAYFKGALRKFDIPLKPAGTPFQRAVWDKLREIPYGETISYGELAGRAGNPKAMRAVGLANNRNPIVIIIPCHRVIGKNGSLTGYGGGLDLKRTLLELEAKKPDSAQ